MKKTKNPESYHYISLKRAVIFVYLLMSFGASAKFFIDTEQWPGNQPIIKRILISVGAGLIWPLTLSGDDEYDYYL